ncbi:hypothetical protein NP233_g12779 [Leucocoprinus birnbaumii]|uniref:Uncharacterized protein n=1 Tax=Leucocoprinus birnbaumii TaxID=56174 RepID=A0AAD5YJ65_9AGAR|nr:hypothetical protein NP233_g12779 [Leucocoprinus birnbaumii]
MDIQATQELANLLGRELVSTKNRVSQLEKQLHKSNTQLKEIRGKKSRQRDPTIELQQEVEGYRMRVTTLQLENDRLRTKAKKAEDQAKEVSKLRHEIENIESQRNRARESAKKAKDKYKNLKHAQLESTAVVQDPFSVVSAFPLNLSRHPTGRYFR